MHPKKSQLKAVCCWVIVTVAQICGSHPKGLGESYRLHGVSLSCSCAHKTESQGIPPGRPRARNIPVIRVMGSPTDQPFGVP